MLILLVVDRLTREILGLPAPMLATWGHLCVSLGSGPLDQPRGPGSVLWLGRCQRAGMIAGFSVRKGLHMKLVTGRWMFFFIFKWGRIFPQVGAEHSCFNALSMHPFRHWASCWFFWVSQGLTKKSPIRWIQKGGDWQTFLLCPSAASLRDGVASRSKQGGRWMGWMVETGHRLGDIFSHRLAGSHVFNFHFYLLCKASSLVDYISITAHFFAVALWSKKHGSLENLQKWPI